MGNEKYIKLSDAKDEFYYALSDHDTAIVDYKDADAILDGVPAADVRPVVRGRWLEGNKRQPCSVCRYKGMRSWNYCPNCGADMREGNDED